MTTYELKLGVFCLFVVFLTACATPVDDVAKTADVKPKMDTKAEPVPTEDKLKPAIADATQKEENEQIDIEAILREEEEKKPVKPAEGKARVGQVKKIMEKKLVIQEQYLSKKRGKDINSFYRFKREKAEPLSLIDDGVHDPAADLSDLQPPVSALKQLPRATFGNGVNWVEALKNHQILPRADQEGKKKQFTLDMNIQMPVAGTMNDVLFPHIAHTAWLACSNCHTGIFQMKRGANPITMKKIIDGKYCGVCHGKVAFPIADCNRCHSVEKQAAAATQ